MEGHCWRQRIQSTENESNWGPFVFEVSLDPVAKWEEIMLTDLAMEYIVKAIGVNENPPRQALEKWQRAETWGISMSRCMWKKLSQRLRDQKEESEEKTPNKSDDVEVKGGRISKGRCKKNEFSHGSMLVSGSNPQKLILWVRKGIHGTFKLGNLGEFNKGIIYKDVRKV